MEVSPLQIPGAENRTEKFAAMLHVQRQRMREFLSNQQDRLRRAETNLSEQLQQIAVELADDRRKTDQTQEELAERAGQIQQQAAVLEQMKLDLADRQAQWEKLYHQVIEQQQSLAEQLKLQQEEFARRQQDIQKQQSAVTASEIQALGERKELEAGLAELKTQQAQLSELRASLQTKQSDLEEQQQDVNAQFVDIEKKRRRLAGEMKAQHAANLKELNRKRIELERNTNAELAESQRRVKSLQDENRILKSKPPIVTGGADRREVEHVKAEKDKLASQLTDLEQQLADTRQELADAQAQRGNKDDSEEDDSLRNSYETAVEELRELKQRCEQLQQQLADSRQTSGGSPSHISSNVLNWEVEKQRILAALEADFEEENEEDREAKLAIQDVINKTNRIVEGKEREVGELRELLESQTNNIGSMAVGAAALGQVLDADAVVQEERKNLARLKEECRDKLRHAEIELSLERAKIAREQAQLEEKLRAMELHGVSLSSVADEKGPAKPTRGRWLARLGLTDTENDQGKSTGN